MNAANISSTEKLLLIPVYIHTKLRYIFASTSFSKEQCANLDKIYCPTIISKMGMNRKREIPILHGSHKYGWQQIPTSWNLQGLAHVQLLVGHLQLNDLIGQHMRHIIDYLYLYLGVQEKPLTYNYNKIKALMPEGWFASTWFFLSEIQATVITNTLELQQQRQNDKSILPPALLHYKGI